MRTLWLVVAPIVLGQPFAASGTLIVVIPTRDGLVIAADSRTTVAGQYFDVRDKLHFLNTDPGVVFTFTGTAEFIPPPPQDIGLESWVKGAVREFDGYAIAASHLQTKWKGQLTKEILSSLAADCVDAASAYFAIRKVSFPRFLGKDLCRFLMVKFRADTKESVIGTFVIKVGPTGTVFADGFDVTHLEQHEARYIGRYGENEYVDKHVLFGEGRSLLPQALGEHWDGPMLISDMSPRSASIIATTLITVTEQVSRFIPIENGVGGQPKIFLLDGLEPPTPLEARLP